MLRTTCLATMSLVVSTWISLTSPSGVTTTRADSTPVRLVMRFSARFTPQGSGEAPPIGMGGCSDGSLASRAGVDGVTTSVSCSHLVAAGGLGTIQRAVRGHQYVLVLGGVWRELGHSDARRHQRLGVAQLFPELLHPAAQLLRHAPGALPLRPDQPSHNFPAPVSAPQTALPHNS